MYLVSVYDQQSLVEASLGGRVTADEVRVFAEELSELLADFGTQPFSLLLDHSKAKRFDHETVLALADLKDLCFKAGAEVIVSVPIDDQDLVMHQTIRLQQVLEGAEVFVSSPEKYQFSAASERATPCAQLRVA